MHLDAQIYTNPIIYQVIQMGNISNGIKVQGVCSSGIKPNVKFISRQRSLAQQRQWSPSGHPHIVYYVSVCMVWWFTLSNAHPKG